jgi:dihydroorotate dehydrogenase (NAD+) catalytic subunit
MVKLSPNVTDITEIARAVEGAGADALSLINTLRGMRIDVHSRRPVLHMNTGGLSGPAVLPVAVRMVWEVAQTVRIPILGMGGVSKGEDAAQLMLAGASAVAVGTACFADPYAPVRVRDGLERLAEAQGLSAVHELTGGVRPWPMV